jgi:hypothetical protein
MYCIHCGKEIPDLALNCPFCGASQLGGAEPAPAAEEPVTLRSLPRRTWAKILLITALACFFLPFITVSCHSNRDDKTVYAQSMNGFEMMRLGSSGFQTEREDENPIIKAAERLPNVFAILAFGMGLIAVLLLFLGKRARAAGGLAVGSAVCLVLLALFFLLLYSPGSPVRAYYPEKTDTLLRTITVRVRFGIWLAAAGFTAGAVFCFRDRPPDEYD